MQFRGPAECGASARLKCFYRDFYCGFGCARKDVRGFFLHAGDDVLVHGQLEPGVEWPMCSLTSFIGTPALTMNLDDGLVLQLTSSPAPPLDRRTDLPYT
jgi:hypothetical protein